MEGGAVVLAINTLIYGSFVICLLGQLEAMRMMITYTKGEKWEELMSAHIFFYSVGTKLSISKHMFSQLARVQLCTLRSVYYVPTTVKIKEWLSSRQKKNQLTEQLAILSHY